MNIKNRLRRIENQNGLTDGNYCRCDAPYRKIPDRDCKNCGKEFDGFSFKPGMEIQVITPALDGYEH